MPVNEMYAEFVVDFVAQQNLLDFLGMFRKKLRLRFVGWKLIVPRVEQFLANTEC